MYKNREVAKGGLKCLMSFNPCFNGSMYKNILNTDKECAIDYGFNPCFNGSMYKNFQFLLFYYNCHKVSILVLMDLCIKTKAGIMGEYLERSFNPCFNGSMYKNQSIGIALMLG